MNLLTCTYCTIDNSQEYIFMRIGDSDQVQVIRIIKNSDSSNGTRLTNVFTTDITTARILARKLYLYKDPINWPE
jgi:hypothetical protein